MWQCAVLFYTRGIDMMYTLNKNVYLVDGKARSCIYDLNGLRLFSINNNLAQAIHKANECGIIEETVDNELKDILNKLVQLELLVLSDHNTPHEISEYRAADNGCVFAWVEITNRCNLRCKHCYNESDAHCETIMSTENYRRVIDRLLELGVKKVQIIGGEPFVEKNRLRELLDYTVGKFPLIEIFTNGTLITEEWYGYLAKNNIHIALSVYSYNKDEHDKVTGQQGSWTKTYNTIASLKANGIPYRVCNVLMSGVELGEKPTDLFELSPDKDIVRMSGRANFALLSDELIRKKLITKTTFQTPLNRKLCSALLSGHNCFRSKIYVSADLKVYPCVMERRFTHCDISDGGKITLCDNIRNMNKDKIEGCCDCEYRYACHDCRPNSLSGEIYEKPWYCTYNPITGEWEDENAFVEKLKHQWGNP